MKSGRFAKHLAFLLSILALSALAPSPARAVDTWGITNNGSAWAQGQEGSAIDGACYGMVLAAKMYHELKLDRVRRFSDVTAPMRTVMGVAQSNQLNVEHFAALAQNYALRNRRPDTELYTLPSDAASVNNSLRGSGVSADKPQILILTNDAEVAANPSVEFAGHAVLVQGREDVGNFINYKISDPNFPGLEKIIFYEKSSGTFMGLGDYDTIRHDITRLPAQNKEWMEALLKGASQPAGKEYYPTWRGNKDLPLKEEEYKTERQSSRRPHMVEPPSPSPGLSKGVSALKSDEVGGVRLYFDPVIVNDTDKDDARWDMIGELVNRMTQGEENFLVQEGSSRKLTAVNLRTVLDNDGQGADLGGLTRVLGLARNSKTGDVYLLGESDASTPAISLDVLSVALKLIWQDKSRPAISLDPDPNDFFGLQHVRLEEFPQDYRNTEFARVMLEADYAMKRIMLGEDTLGIDGYASFAELLQKNPDASSGEYFRWWMCPRETAGAAVYHAKQNDMEVYLYDSDVKLLTETLKRADSGLVGTGTRDILTETASNAFTQYYSKIEEQRPIFRQLHGLFDVAKLAAVLRSENATDKILSEIAQRQVGQVHIEDYYAGIGPRTIPVGTDASPRFLMIGGGVQINNVLRPGDFVQSDAEETVPDLENLAQSGADSSTIEFRIPSVVPLDPKNARLADGDAEASRGLDEIMAGDFKGAIARMDRVLKQEPSHARARTVRATANMMLGKFAPALRDIDVAVKSEPWLRAYRGRIRVSAGDIPGGLADARAAAIQFPDNPEVLVQKTWVDTETLNLSDARKDFQALRAMLPSDTELDILGNQIRVLSQMKPSQAQAYVKAQFAIPVSTSLAMSRAMALSKQGQLSEASSLIKQIINSRAGQPGTKDPLYFKERCWLLLVTMGYRGGTKESVGEARSYLNMLQKQHPNWPSPLYYRVMLDGSMTYAQAAQLYLKAAKMSVSGDPLLAEERINNGINLRTQTGFQLSMAGVQQVGSDKGRSLKLVYSVMDQATAAGSQGPARHLISLLKKSLAVQALELKGKKLSAAENKRLNDEFAAAMLKLPPVPAGSDKTDLLALKMIASNSLQPLCTSAETSEELSEVGLLFAAIVKGLSSDWALASTLKEAAQENYTAHGIYAAMLARQIAKDEEYVSLKTQYDEGSVDAGGYLEGIDHIAEPMAGKQDGVSQFSRDVLRATVYTRYLAQTDQVELNEAISTRLSLLADTVEGSVHGLVETRTGKIWLSDVEAFLLPQIEDKPLRDRMIADFHRRASRLDQRFALEAALH